MFFYELSIYLFYSFITDAVMLKPICCNYKQAFIAAAAAADAK